MKTKLYKLKLLVIPAIMYICIGCEIDVLSSNEKIDLPNVDIYPSYPPTWNYPDGSPATDTLNDFN